MLPRNFRVWESLKFIERNFPRSLRTLMPQARQLAENLRESFGCQGIAVAQSCSITQMYLCLGRLSIYRKQLQKFDLSRIYLMIGSEFYITGCMYYIPYDFDLDELKQHLATHLKEIKLRRRRPLIPHRFYIQLSFEFAA